MATKETTHQRWRAAPVTRLAALIGDRPILILAPHPDDETIGCGGLIYQAVRAGVSVAIDFLTDGSRSHQGSKEFGRAELTALRQAEATKAVAHLGVNTKDIHFWGEEDSHLAASGGRADRLAAALRKRIVETGAGTIFVTWIDDPHCDHEAAFSLALASLEGLEVRPHLYAYPVWAWTIETQRSVFEGSVVRLDIVDELYSKREALACHASQLGKVITDDPEGFSLSAADLALFMQPYETFIAVKTPPK